MSILILGAGAFGTALAVALGRERQVALWGRGLEGRQSARLPGVRLPENVTVMADLQKSKARTILLAVPMQALSGFAAENASHLRGRRLVACCKGVDLSSGRGPTAILADIETEIAPAILTGPSFAADIAAGLPTALTLACADPSLGKALQAELSTPVLRLYRSADPIGAELGGALKNVIAIAAGVVIGAGLGDSARAALMTRGYAEMQRFALFRGAKAETLAGLSGFGDLVLTCTSQQSRNFRFGMALGRGEGFDTSVTVEGIATAKSVSNIAHTAGLETPITTMVAALCEGRIALPQAINNLMTRPLKEE